MIYRRPWSNGTYVIRRTVHIMNWRPCVKYYIIVYKIEFQGAIIMKKVIAAIALR